VILPHINTKRLYRSPLKNVKHAKRTNLRGSLLGILNRGLHSGILLLSVAILLSGNNYQKIATLSKFLKLPIVSSSTFHKIQRTYMIPSIDRFLIQEQESVISQFRDQTSVLIVIWIFFTYCLNFLGLYLFFYSYSLVNWLLKQYSMLAFNMHQFLSLYSFLYPRSTRVGGI
jgi:hypothetical protein